MLRRHRIELIQRQLALARGDAQARVRCAVPQSAVLLLGQPDPFRHGAQERLQRKARVRPADGNRKLPGIAAEDIGRCAYGIFQRGRELIGKTVGIAGDHLSGGEMAAALSRALGREVVHADVPPEVYRGFGFPGADDLGNMFQFKRDFNDDFRRPRSVARSRALNSALQSFDQWLKRSADRIPLA
jgi:uncharacterized protein YbjT (DUF2867 family)